MVIATVRFGHQLRLPYVDASVQTGTSCTLLHPLSVTSVSVQVLRIPVLLFVSLVCMLLHLALCPTYISKYIDCTFCACAVLML